MDKPYYPTTHLKIALFVVSLLLLALIVFVSNEILLAFACLAGMVTIMAHFSFFEYTNDTNILNRADLVLQAVIIVVGIIKFMVISNS